MRVTPSMVEIANESSKGAWMASIELCCASRLPDALRRAEGCAKRLGTEHVHEVLALLPSFGVEAGTESRYSLRVGKSSGNG